MRPILAALMAATLLLAACGDDSGDDETTSADSTEAPDSGDAGDTGDGSDSAAEDAGGNDETSTDPTSTAGADVPEEFDFVLDDVRGGDPVDGSAYAGTDVVVWFWAPWCTLCNREAPTIAEIAASRDDVTFLGMSGLDSKDAAADFVDRHGLDGFAHAFDEDGGTWQAFGITSQSSFAFVNDDGSVDTVSYSTLGRDEIERRIDELVTS